MIMKLRIREIRQARDLTLQELADKAGLSRSYLTEMELGAKTINAIRMGQIAKALGVTVADLIPSEQYPIEVVGRVGAGAKVPLVEVDEQRGGLYQINAPAQLRRNGPPRDFVAVEVEGDSMVPMYQPGDLLFYTRANHEGIPSEDIGRPCIVEDTSGKAWVKLVKRGDEPELFHLISLNPASETRHNQRIKWAARVRLALPREMVDECG